MTAQTVKSAILAIIATIVITAIAATTVIKNKMATMIVTAILQKWLQQSQGF